MSTLRDNIKEKKSPFPNEILHPPLADQNDERQSVILLTRLGLDCQCLLWNQQSRTSQPIGLTVRPFIFSLILPAPLT